jgi:hypothetical protein
MHIFHNRHQYGPADETQKLLKQCNKGTKMNCWAALYMNMHYKQDLLIAEQQVTDTNPLYDLAIIPRDLQANPSHSTHTLQGKSRSVVILLLYHDIGKLLVTFCTNLTHPPPFLHYRLKITLPNTDQAHDKRK